MRYDREYRHGPYGRRAAEKPLRLPEAGPATPGPEYGYEYGMEPDHAYETEYGGAPPEGELRGRGEYGEAYEPPFAGEWEPRGPRQAGAPHGRSRARTRTGFHGYGMGYGGGALRSRGSFQAGQLRSGLNPEDEFEFEWGEGYVGGRGYAGTNYDLHHGYRVGSPREEMRRGWRPGPERLGGEGAERREATGSERGGPAAEPAARGGYEWGEERARLAQDEYGPGRYGYGPYHERLRRRRRSDDDIREEVEEALFYDTWVDADRIEVAVEDGVVTLKGDLPNYEEVRYATDDAWDVDGVRGVRSELSVSEMEGESEGE